MIALRKGQEVQSSNDIFHVASNERFCGGQAWGYKVKNRRNEDLFLKQFSEPTVRSPDAESFVRRQRALLSRLTLIPDFVCRELEFFELGGIFYKVTELMTGQTLRNKDKRVWRRWDRETTACALAFSVAQIHEHGIAHLDLSPANCFLADKTIDGRVIPVVRIFDFDAGLVENAPRPAHILGTPPYHSPEHRQPELYGLPGPRSDVFSLAVILHQILTGRLPFSSMDEVLNSAANRPEHLALVIDRDVTDILWRALDPKPDRRPSAREIHQTLLRRGQTRRVPADPVNSPGVVTLVSGTVRLPVPPTGLLGRELLQALPEAGFVSARQARIIRAGKGWQVCQLESALNPTYLNGSLLEMGSRYPLGNGDILKIGDLELTVELEE